MFGKIFSVKTDIVYRREEEFESLRWQEET